LGIELAASPIDTLLHCRGELRARLVPAKYAPQTTGKLQ